MLRLRRVFHFEEVTAHALAWPTDRRLFEHPGHDRFTGTEFCDELPGHGLTGLGAYGASFDPHRTLGSVIGLLTVLMSLLVLAARTSWLTAVLTLVLAMLAFAGQPSLAGLGDDTNA